MQRDVECELEDGPARGARDAQLGRRRIRPRLVLLPGEQERLELDLDALPRLVAGADPERAEVEGGHAATVARRDPVAQGAKRRRSASRGAAGGKGRSCASLRRRYGPTVSGNSGASSCSCGWRARTSIPTEATTIAAGRELAAADRLSRERPAEQDGDRRVDVRVGRDENARRAAPQQPAVRGERNDRAEDDEEAERRDRAHRDRRRMDAADLAHRRSRDAEQRGGTEHLHRGRQERRLRQRRDAAVGRARRPGERGDEDHRGTDGIDVPARPDEQRHAERGRRRSRRAHRARAGLRRTCGRGAPRTAAPSRRGARSGPRQPAARPRRRRPCRRTGAARRRSPRPSTPAGPAGQRRRRPATRTTHREAHRRARNERRASAAAAASGRRRRSRDTSIPRRRTRSRARWRSWPSWLHGAEPY